MGSDKIRNIRETLLFRGLSKTADNVYLFINDMQANYSVWSDNAVEYFGLPKNYEYNLGEFWVSRVHPDDREGYEADLAALFGGKKKSHYYQYRAKNAQGQYVWLECHGCVEYDEEGDRSYFVGIITRLDVTGKYDSITNCLNLNEFYLHEFREYKAIFLIGIDSFRKIVNRIGFSESNPVLAKLGEVLQRNLGNDRVYRMTGDEFIGVCPSFSKEEIEYLFQKILREFQQEVQQTENIKISFSGGALYFAPQDDKEEAIKKLEHCLEHSKQKGNGTLTIFSSIIEEEHLRRERLQSALTHAISHDFKGFKLAYQPIVRAKTHELDGAEALLRFYCEGIGIVSPVEFIPILEASGEIREVGKWVAKSVIEQKAKWDQLYRPIRVGFNVSLVQLQNKELAENIAAWVREYVLRPDEIIVELTESRRMDDADLLRDAISPLTQAGIWVLLDDFGMESSTFTMVQELPINGVKVDHSFVRVMVGSGSERKDRANKAIIASISFLGKQLGLRVVVEGVENEKIDEILYSMDIQYEQGYYYSRPILVEEFEKTWLRR